MLDLPKAAQLSIYFGEGKSVVLRLFEMVPN